MSTNTDNQNYDRDRNQQRDDRDQTDNSSYSSTEGQTDERTNRGRDNYSSDSDSSTRDIEMRWQEIENNYRRRYPNLTDEDLNYREGEFNTMTDRIADKTNRSRQEVHDEIWEWDSDLFDFEDEYDTM